MATIKKANFNKEDAEILINKKELIPQCSIRFLNTLSIVFFVLGAISIAADFSNELKEIIAYEGNNLLVGFLSFGMGFLIRSEKKVSLVKTFREK